jgi:hypothetical protein
MQSKFELPPGEGDPAGGKGRHERLGVKGKICVDRNGLYRRLQRHGDLDESFHDY